MASGVGWVAAWSSCWKITVCFDIGRLICASKYSRTSDSTLQPAMTSIRVMCGGWRSDARSGVNLQSLGIHSSTLQPLCISNFVISGLPVKTAAINGVVPQWSAVSSWAPADSRRLTTAVCPASIAFINGVFCSPFSVLCTNHKLHYLHIISPIYSSAAHVYKSNCPDLRSSANTAGYVKPHLTTKFGEHAFSFAGPASWNSLPAELRSVSDSTVFKNKL